MIAFAAWMRSDLVVAQGRHGAMRAVAGMRPGDSPTVFAGMGDWKLVM